MAQQNVCKYNKYGFCKFRTTCRKQHIEEICSKNSCESEKCYFRHPKVCRFYREIGYCKFGEWCFFKHESNFNKNVEAAMKKADSKIEILENDLKILKNCLDEKDSKIGKLEEKILS